MLSRLTYYARRAREAGVLQTSAKLWQKASPYWHWPLYARSRWPKADPQEVVAFRKFGKVCEAAFRQAGERDPSRQARAKHRLALADSPGFPVLGYGVLPKPSGSEWRADSLHGHKWGRAYFPLCDFLASNVKTDVKIPWELSRLQWFVWLAEATIYTQGDAQLQRKNAIISTVDDWAKANPAGYGVNWTCGMEVAIRATNIAVACGTVATLCEDSEVERICSVLRAHLDYLKRFPEYSDVPGNHYLTDLMGEVVLHAALHGLHSAPFEQSMDVFADEADRQFEPDGCHIERATIYHRLTYDILALPFALANRAGIGAAKALRPTVRRAAKFIAQIAGEHGNLPVFGDQDSGFVLWFLEVPQQIDRRVAGSAGGPETDLYSFLIALADDPAFLPDVPSGPGKRSGFATIAGGQFHVTMKTGPLGLAGRAPHDHDDALSVCASFAGHRLLIDPGCHSYTLDADLRTEFILSSKHNAPIPVGRERHCASSGSINATMRGAPTASLTCHNADKAQGRVAATPHSKMDVQRTIAASGTGMQISDEWQFESPAGARILWILDPAWELHDAQLDVWIEVADQAASPKLLLQIASARLSAVLKLSAGAKYKVGRVRASQTYGAFVDCWSIRIETTPCVRGQASLAFLLDDEGTSARAVGNM